MNLISSNVAITNFDGFNSQEKGHKKMNGSEIPDF
jgi:hypothetical protein